MLASVLFCQELLVEKPVEKYVEKPVENRQNHNSGVQKMHLRVTESAVQKMYLP